MSGICVNLLEYIIQLSTGLRKQYDRNNLNSTKYKSRKPHKPCTIDFAKNLLIETKKKGITIKLIQPDNGHEFLARVYLVGKEDHENSSAFQFSLRENTSQTFTTKNHFPQVPQQSIRPWIGVMAFLPLLSRTTPTGVVSANLFRGSLNPFDQRLASTYRLFYFGRLA